MIAFSMDFACPDSSFIARIVVLNVWFAQCRGFKCGTESSIECDRVREASDTRGVAAL